MDYLIIYLLIAFFYAYLAIKIPNTKYLSYLKIFFIGLAMIHVCSPFVIQETVLGSNTIEFNTFQNVTLPNGTIQFTEVNVTQVSYSQGVLDYNWMLLFLNSITLFVTIFLVVLEVATKSLEDIQDTAEGFEDPKFNR